MTPHATSWTSDLDARYELLDEAGRGGMGVVYKARDRETGEIVALKILKPEIAADRVAAERFINEVRLSRRITHKNVTRVYEFTRAGSTAYLSMEFVDGESLRSIVDRIGAVHLRKGVQIARQICAALYEAHSQGIVHRDLKPENVMLDKAGNVKVMDFGIARLLDTSVTATAGGIIGTPAYMAPEQAEGRDVDARTDIYAVGLILYEIFTGRTAFTGDTPMVVALKQIRETPAAPRTIDDTIPWELEAVILRCLAKDPAERFQSVEELDAALAAVPLGTTATGAMPAVDPAARATGEPTWPSVARAQTTPLGQRSGHETAGAGGTQAPTTAAAGPAPSGPITDGSGSAGRRRRTLLLVGAAALAAVALAAVLLLRGGDEAVPFETFALNNGLQVILAPDDSTPTIGVAVTYRVGAKDDPQGREGLAHLFEHMMFNGSLNVGKGEHHALVVNQGGQPNGSAYMDHTQVWETLPANQLDLALFLEADRMRSLRLDEARLESERGTVLAERQQRIDNQPYGRALDAIYDLAYDIPAYKKHHIGTDAGLRAVTLQEVSDFFRIFYAPNNAVLTVAGNFDPDEARRRIENYFQHIPAQPPAPDIDLSGREQTAERRATIEDPFAASPRTYVAYKIPAGASRETEAVLLLYSVLAEGAASRLQQTLVRDQEVSTAAGGSIEQRKGPGMIIIAMQPAPGRDEAALLAAFDGLIARLQEEMVAPEELARAKRRLALARATAMQQTAQRALLLGEFQVKFGDAGLLNARDEWLESITAEEVREAARRYLRPELRSILTVVRGGTPTPGFTSAAASVPVPTERFNRAPVSKDVLRVTLPPGTETRLDNGLTLLVAEERRSPLVSARFEIRGAGTVQAPADNPAIPVLAVAMLREGTSSRSSRQISEALDEHGVTLSFSLGIDPGTASIQATGLSATVGAWLPVVADMITNATFPVDELTLMKRRFGAEWRGRSTQPLSLAMDIFGEAMYGPEAARRIPVEAFAGVTSEQLKVWQQERYTPRNTVLALAGDLDADDAVALVRDAFGRWSGDGTARPADRMTAPDRARVLIIDRPGSVQTTLVMGVPTVDRAHEDLLPLTVANRVLGGDATARLFISLREQRGLTFSAFSLLNAYKHGGDWRSYSEINSARIEEGIEAFAGELRRIGTEPIPVAELDAAKRGTIASFALTLESLPQVVAYMATRAVYGLSTDYWDRYPEKMMAVTPEDVHRVAKQYMDLGRLQVVAVGDAARLQSLLAPLGEVTIVK